MATRNQIERFFEGTGISINDVRQGKDGFIYLTNGELGLTIASDVQANKLGDMNQPKLVITYEKRL